MTRSLALLGAAAALALTAAPAAEAEVVGFSNGQYDGYENWNWDALTVLGFWTPPNATVRAVAKAHGVRLFKDSGSPPPADWSDAAKRKAWVAEAVATVQSDALDGLFFDYEGSLTDDQKGQFVTLAGEASAALKPLNASVFVCVGARPSYEFRSYDYAGLANATEFLFIMGYDAHFWDDYTCVTKGTCSPAEASIKDLSLGVTEYLQEVPGDKLVLGLPWYGQVYTQLVLPINRGQIDYKDVLAVLDNGGRVQKKELDRDSQTWVITCNGACVDGKKGGKIWIDDATTLAPKYALAKDQGLRGVGVWEITKAPTDGAHVAEHDAMWAALAAWDGGSAATAA